METFKNLNAAKEAYTTLETELTALKESSTQTAEQLDTLQVEKEELTGQVNNFKTALEAASAQIKEKDASIESLDKLVGELKGGNEVLQVRCTDLEKNQKSVKAQARELVAASAGTPAAVDNSELKLTEQELVKAMAKEQDSKKLSALYNQYNKNFRKGK